MQSCERDRRPGEKCGKQRKAGVKARAHFRAPAPGVLVQSDRVIVSRTRSPSPRLQLVSRPKLYSILIRASTRGTPASTPADRPPPPAFPRWPFPRGAPAGSRGDCLLEPVIRPPRGAGGGGGGEDTLSPTVAVINFKGVSLGVNEYTLDGWPEASRPLRQPSAHRPGPRRAGLQNEPHFSLVFIFQAPQLRGGDRRVRGWGAHTHTFWGEAGRVNGG